MSIRGKVAALVSLTFICIIDFNKLLKSQFDWFQQKLDVEKSKPHWVDQALTWLFALLPIVSSFVPVPIPDSLFINAIEMASVNKSSLKSNWVALQRMTGDFPPRMPKPPRTANLSYINAFEHFSSVYKQNNGLNLPLYKHYGLSVREYFGDQSLIANSKTIMLIQWTFRYNILYIKGEMRHNNQ